MLKPSGRFLLCCASFFCLVAGVSAQETIVHEHCPSPKKANTMCKFLGDNYDEMRARCGLLSKRNRTWWPPNWFRSYQPIDSVPARVLYGIDKEAFLKPATKCDGSQPAESQSAKSKCAGSQSTGSKLTGSKPDPNTDWIETNRFALIRLLSSVGCKSGDTPPPCNNPGNDPTDFSGFPLNPGSDPDSINQILNFDPLFPPNRALIKGVTSVVDTMSCDEVAKATQEARGGIAFASATEKATAGNSTKNDYRLVYGVFQSPMRYMKFAAPVTYYLEAADWYLRNLGSSSQKGELTYTPPKYQPYYVAAARAAVVYDESSDQSNGSLNLGGSAQYSVSPLASVSGSASYQHTTLDNEANHQYRALLSKSIVFEQLPSWEEVAGALSSAQVVTRVTDPAFDSKTGEVTATFAVNGMPSSLCKPGIWIPHQSGPGYCKNTSKNTSKNPSFDITSVQEFFDGVNSNGQISSGILREQCRFTLSRKLKFGTGALDGSFEGDISPIRSPEGRTIKLPISGADLQFPAPKLTLFSAPAKVTEAGAFAGSFLYQLWSDNYLDKSAKPRTSKVPVSCTNAKAGSTAQAGSTNPTAKPTIQVNCTHAKGKPAVTDINYVATAPVPVANASVAPTKVNGSFVQIDFTATPADDVSKSKPVTCRMTGSVTVTLLGGESGSVVLPQE